jgi:dUTP pyrophosphatase
MNIVQEFDVELFGGDDLWMPTMATEDDACFDVRARAVMTRDKNIHVLGELVDAGLPEKTTKVPMTWSLEPGNRIIVLTGVFVELRSGWEIQVRPRSGLAWKSAITISNSPGTVDARYRDEIGVILSNDEVNYSLGGGNFLINRGDRIAQLAFREVPPVRLKKVDKISREFDRGGGFGHSGVQDFFPNAKDYLFLKVGDQWQNGDEYGTGFGPFVVGTKQTGIKEGDVVQLGDMCYSPRRKIKKTEA